MKKLHPGASQREVVDAININADQLIHAYTPTSAADTSRPHIKYAADASYFYNQVTVGAWKRAALSTW